MEVFIEECDFNLMFLKRRGGLMFVFGTDSNFRGYAQLMLGCWTDSFVCILPAGRKHMEVCQIYSAD